MSKCVCGGGGGRTRVECTQCILNLLSSPPDFFFFFRQPWYDPSNERSVQD